VARREVGIQKNIPDPFSFGTVIDVRTTGIIVHIVHRPLRRDFLREPIQTIVGSGDRRGDRPTRIFLLYLRDAIPGIVGVVRGRAVVIRGFRAAVQGVVRVGGHLALAIRDRDYVPIVVIGIRFRVEQGIFSRPRTVHIVVGVYRLLGLRIGHGEEIAVRIIGECRIAVDGIRELRNTIQGIRRIERLLAEGVGEFLRRPAASRIRWVSRLSGSLTLTKSPASYVKVVVLFNGSLMVSGCPYAFTVIVVILLNAFVMVVRLPWAS
jgi:hypothetical protein